jgi:hypothetical protein
MPNWSRIQELIPSGNLTPAQLEFAQAHDSTSFKIRFADYHLSILQQIYRPQMTDSEEDTKNWARAEMHSIILNLYSALDSLGYEINLAYKFGIDPGKIHIHHIHKTRMKSCLRCEVNNQNDNVTCYLNNFLGLPWFERFNKLRNQITHKHLPIIDIIISVGNGGTFTLRIPNDPTNSNPIHANGDYSDNLELRQYCKDTRIEVLNTVEDIYCLIQQRIPQIL